MLTHNGSVKVTDVGVAKLAGILFWELLGKLLNDNLWTLRDGATNYAFEFSDLQSAQVLFLIALLVFGLHLSLRRRVMISPSGVLLLYFKTSGIPSSFLILCCL